MSMTLDFKSINEDSEISFAIESSDFSLWYKTGRAKNSLFSISSKFLLILLSAMLLCTCVGVGSDVV